MLNDASLAGEIGRHRGCDGCPLPGSTRRAPVATADAGLNYLWPRAGRIHRAGDEIYQQGGSAEHCFVLTSGWAALLTLLDNGRRQVFDFAIPGTLIGFRPDPRSAMSHAALCLSRTTVCRIESGRLRGAASSRPWLGMQLLQVMVHHEDRVRDHLASIACRDARGRIARLMVELFHRIRRRLPSRTGETVCLPLTLPLIGDAVGLTNVHVSRTLRALREEGVLQFNAQSLVVLDPDAMIRAAGYEGEAPEIVPEPAYCELMAPPERQRGAAV